MEKKKIFVLDLVCGEDLGFAIEYISKKKGLKTEVEINNLQNGKLPKKYDIYFLHLSELDRENLNQLKGTQPESYFYEIGRGGGLYKGKKRLTREEHKIFTQNNIKEILMRGITHKST